MAWQQQNGWLFDSRLCVLLLSVSLSLSVWICDMVHCYLLLLLDAWWIPLLTGSYGMLTVFSVCARSFVPPPMLLVNTWSLVQQRPSSSCSFDINICWLVHQSTSHDSFIQAVGSSRHYFMTAADWLWCQYMFSIVALWTAAFYLICVVQQYMWLHSVLAVEQSDHR